MKTTKTFLITALVLSFNLFAKEKAPPVSTKEQTEVVKAISKQLQDNYIFPKVADKMASHIKKQNKKGQYKNLTKPLDFAIQLTEDLQAISKDLHIRVMFNPEAIARQKQAVSEEDQQKLLARRIEHAKQDNFGFKEVKILDGNIGYLNLTSFSETSYAGETAVAAMNFLSNTDAIIFDLRKNGGGSPSMIQLITSYFYEGEPVHLNNFYWRPTDLHTQTWTLPHVSGKRSPDTPVYVLTSNRSFSAAEEFSYNLKNLERATVIGEITGGGAHPGDTVNATDRFQVWVPSGRAINPITKTNWEGKGVEPHIQVKQTEALSVAHIKAIESLLEKSTEKENIQKYTWKLQTLKAMNNLVTIDESKLNSYVGHYGPRKIVLEGKKLIYQRGNGPKYQLHAMSQNEFMIKELPYFRIKFDKSQQGTIQLTGHYDDGHSDTHPKKPS